MAEEFKVAIIPTLDQLQLSGMGDFDLVEVPWCTDYYPYRRYYSRRARGDNRYIILDNGAALASRSVPEAAIDHTMRYVKADEVVAPDVIKQGAASFSLSMAYLMKFSEAVYRDEKVLFKLLIVPQGRDYKEWTAWYKRTIGVVHAMELQSHVIIGIPKWLTREPMNRVELLAGIDSVATNMDHHLLGGGRFLIREVLEAIKVPFFRGIDTSAPVALALEGIPLETDTELPSQRVFNPVQKLDNVKLAQRNIHVLLKAAQGLKLKEKPDAEAPKSEV